MNAEDWAYALQLIHRREYLSLLIWMTEHGQSVTLTWGEDVGGWECSWTSGDKRFTGVFTEPVVAITTALMRCRRAWLERQS